MKNYIVIDSTEKNVIVNIPAYDDADETDVAKAVQDMIEKKIIPGNTAYQIAEAYCVGCYAFEGDAYNQFYRLSYNGTIPEGKYNIKKYDYTWYAEKAA